MPLRPGLRAARVHPPDPLTPYLDRLRRSHFVQEAVRVGRALAQEWRDDRVTGLAAEVAFFAMLALFPALLATAALLGSLDSVAGQELAARAQNAVLTAMDRVFTDDANDLLDAVRMVFTEKRPGVLTLSALGALFAAARGFVGLIRALDAAYDVEEQRSWFQIIPTAVLLALGSVLVAVVMLAMLVLGPLLGGGRELADALGFGGAFAFFWDVARAPFAFGVLVVWAATLFHLAPDHRTSWRNHLPGALMAAVLWLLTSLGFRLYLDLAAGANPVFGLLGGPLLLLLWLYLLGIGLLLGGELNAILAPPRR